MKVRANRGENDIAIALDVAEAIISMAAPRKAMNYKKCCDGMSSEVSNVTTFVIPDESTVYFMTGFLKALSPASIKLVIQIGDELKTNNALWYFDHANNRSAINALKELRERKALFPLSNNIYYINPLCIRKGSAIVVAEKTKEIILEYRGACQEAIKPLGYKMNAVSIEYDSKSDDVKQLNLFPLLD